LGILWGMSARQSSRKKSSGGIGCLIWIALFLVICLLFVLNKGKIEKVLNNTNFVNLWQNRNSPKPSASPGLKPSASPSALPSASPSTLPSASPSAKPSASPSALSTPRPSERPDKTAKPSISPKPDKSPAASTLENPKPKTRIATLCLVRVEDDGSIILKEVKRSLPVSDSPLFDSLNALMKGPSADDIKSGYMSLVPQGSKILSVTMRGSTAEVNLSEAFMYNSLGVEGYVGQLKQIVWTATAFPNVHDVQFLIEGRHVEFMGGEGVYVGIPKSRNSF
jgi:germination protein M